MSVEEIFEKASLYELCKNNPTLRHVNIENATTETMRSLLNINNQQTMREVPIWASKMLIRYSVTFACKKFPSLNDYINPNDIRVCIEDDEKHYLQTHESTFKPSLPFIVAKNTLINLCGKTLQELKLKLAPTTEQGNIPIDNIKSPAVKVTPPNMYKFMNKPSVRSSPYSRPPSQTRHSSQSSQYRHVSHSTQSRQSSRSTHVSSRPPSADFPKSPNADSPNNDVSSHSGGSPNFNVDVAFSDVGSPLALNSPTQTPESQPEDETNAYADAKTDILLHTPTIEHIDQLLNYFENDDVASDTASIETTSERPERMPVTFSTFNEDEW